MADLSVDIAGVRFPNPLIVGSCSLTNDLQKIERLVAEGAGGIITKTISPDPLPGPPRTFSTGRFRRSLAVAGDPRLTMEDGVELVAAARKSVDLPIVANVIGRSLDVEAWVDACRALEYAGADMVELDLNGHPEGDVTLDVPRNLSFYDTVSIGQDAEATAYIVRSVREALSIPVISKLTLRAPDLLGVAGASVAAGADAVSGVNTLHAVADLDIDRLGAPALPGLETQSLVAICGPDLGVIGTKWTALVCKFIDRPYISGSGIADARDVIERILLGAHATAICSTIYLNGAQVIGEILTGLREYLDSHQLASCEALRGCAAEFFVERGQPIRRASLPQITDHERWAAVAERVWSLSHIECRCIEKGADSISFDETRCTGCGLPAFHAPDAVKMVTPPG